MSGLHPERIKAEIKIAFGSLGAFERAKELPDRSVHDVLRGRSVRQTEDAIASFLKLPVAGLFPRRKAAAESDAPDNTSEKSDGHRLTSGVR